MAATIDSVHAQHAEKTRYVYLWDVTGSTKTGGLYDVISNFMVGDIKSKFSRTPNENNIEIVIIPFNDDTKDIYSYKITKDGIKPNSGSPELDAITGGIDEKLVNAHNELWKNNQGAKIDNGGYTNIAAALTEAEKYISNDWNTIFILLTDGGQEYYISDNKKLEIAKSKKDNVGLSKARDYLVKTITSFDKELKSMNDDGESFNMLFYVITAGDNYDPSQVFKGSDYTQFINTNGSSINLHFSTIEANQPSAISIDDKKFEIYFPIKREELLDKIGIQVTANIEGLTINCQHKINSNGCIEVQPSSGSFAEAFKASGQEGEVFTFDVSLSLYDFNLKTTRNFLDFGNNTNKDFVWFKSNETKLTIKVINDFNPTLTVKFKNNER